MLDTASLIGALTSFDVASLNPPLTALGGIVDSVFSVITSGIDMGAGLFAGAAGSIQTALGSVGGM